MPACAWLLGSQVEPSRSGATRPFITRFAPRLGAPMVWGALTSGGDGPEPARKLEARERCDGAAGQRSEGAFMFRQSSATQNLRNETKR